MEDELSRQTLDAFFHQLTNFGRSMIAQLPEGKAKELFVVAAPATSTLLRVISFLSRAAPDALQTFLFAQRSYLIPHLHQTEFLHSLRVVLLLSVELENATFSKHFSLWCSLYLPDAYLWKLPAALTTEKSAPFALALLGCDSS